MAQDIKIKTKKGIIVIPKSLFKKDEIIKMFEQDQRYYHIENFLSSKNITWKYLEKLAILRK